MLETIKEVRLVLTAFQNIRTVFGLVAVVPSHTLAGACGASCNLGQLQGIGRGT